MRLKSVSTCLAACFPFDAEKVSGCIAKETGQSSEEVKLGWKKQYTLSSNVHKAIKTRLSKPTTTQVHELHGEEQKYIPAALEAVNKVLVDYDCIATEFVIASLRHNVGGLVDFIGRNKKTGAILIVDWKATTGYNRTIGLDETPALGLLSHLPNRKRSRYAVEVLAYGHILRQEGYEEIFGESMNMMEYRVVQLAKNLTGDVVCEHRTVTGMDVLQTDRSMKTDELIKRVLTGTAHL
jgi:hypothetical protein